MHSVKLYSKNKYITGNGEFGKTNQNLFNFVMPAIIILIENIILVQIT
jgi:hypothetical protein